MNSSKTFESYFSGETWVKVYSHNVEGGFFPSVYDGLQYNEDDPKANLYSILYRLEEFRKDGVFHIRFCWEYLITRHKFPCNEWKQSSNFAIETTITDFEPLAITFEKSGVGGTFGGLGVSPPSFCCNLIDDLPDHGNWFYSVGTVMGWAVGFPGPFPTDTMNAQIYIKTGNQSIFDEMII